MWLQTTAVLQRGGACPIQTAAEIIHLVSLDSNSTPHPGPHRPRPPPPLAGLRRTPPPHPHWALAAAAGAPRPYAPAAPHAMLQRTVTRGRGGGVRAIKSSSDGGGKRSHAGGAGFGAIKAGSALDECITKCTVQFRARNKSPNLGRSSNLQSVLGIALVSLRHPQRAKGKYLCHSHTYGCVPQLPHIIVVANKLAHRLVRQVVALNELKLTVMLPHT